MPTLPENAALAFGADARRYHKARPDYPHELIDRILATAAESATAGRENAALGTSVLDVGCGTGKVAAQLRAAGATVLAVEPDARMAALAQAAGIDVEIAKFEQWDPAGRTFDVVTAGQVWHWVDPVAGAAKAAQVTRPGGLFTVFWNAAQPPAPLAEAFAEAYRRILPELPVAKAAQAEQGSAADGYARLGGQAFAHTRTGDAFGEMREWRFPWERYYTRAEWLETVPTFGGQADVPPEKMAALLEAIGDAIGEGFTMAYTTVALAAIRND